MLSLVEPNPANWGKSCSFQPPTDCAQRGEEQENHIKDQALRDRRTTDPVLIINFNLELCGADDIASLSTDDCVKACLKTN